MATVHKSITTIASLDDVWSAISDVGALHTRLVPGFVTDTVVDGRTRTVTFADGRVVREPIVSVDPVQRRPVWTAIGDLTTHYQGALTARSHDVSGTQIDWVSDFLPDDISTFVESAMTAGVAAMQTALDQLG